jgi:hypothetical protein
VFNKVRLFYPFVIFADFDYILEESEYFVVNLFVDTFGKLYFLYLRDEILEYNIALF